MGLFRLIIFFLFTYFLMRFLGKLFSALTGKNTGPQVKGRPEGSAHFKKKQDIEDAEYEELK